MNFPVPSDPPCVEPAREGGAGALKEERREPAFEDGATLGGRDVGPFVETAVVPEGGECV